DEPGSSRERQDRRDACQAFLVVHATWVDNCRRALQRSLLPPQRVKAADTAARQGGRLELLAEGGMDNQILASRLALRVLDLASTELNELRLRIQSLEQLQEMPRGDVLLPDVTTRVLVDQWLEVALSREAWQMVQDAVAPLLAQHMHEAYKATNQFLIASGVMKQIDLNALVRRAPGARSDPRAPTADGQHVDAPAPGGGRGPAGSRAGRAAGGDHPGAGLPSRSGMTDARG